MPASRGVSYDAAAGASELAVMAKAGHRSMSTTKTYLHLAGVVFRNEAEELERRMLGSLAAVNYQPDGQADEHSRKDDKDERQHEESPTETLGGIHKDLDRPFDVEVRTVKRHRGTKLYRPEQTSDDLSEAEPAQGAEA